MPTPAPTPALPTGAVDPALFDGVRAHTHVAVLAGRIGKRVAGTEGGKQGIDYIRQQFESYGLQVELQGFPVRSFEDKSTKLTLTAPQARDVEVQVMIFSPSGTVTAPLVAVPGLGRPEDYRGIDVKGKLALVQRGEFFLSEKARHAAQAGALGVIIYNNQPQAFTGTLRDQASIPTVAVSGQEGQALLDLLKRGPVAATLDVQTEVAERQGANVIARRPGNEQVLVFGGHIDSVPAGPGANDNASGAAVVLELARVLARSNRPETLVFIGFDAEELGLIGSEYYVQQLSQEERRRVKAMFNFDMLGATDNELVFIGSGPLTDLAATSAGKLGISGRPGSLNGGGSDHQSFIDAGIPAVFFFRDDPLFHTPQDTPDRVRPAHLAAAGKTALGMLEQLK